MQLPELQPVRAFGPKPAHPAPYLSSVHQAPLFFRAMYIYGCNSLYLHLFLCFVLCLRKISHHQNSSHTASVVESLAATGTQRAMHLRTKAKSAIEHPLAIADPIKHCRAPSEDFAAHSELLHLLSLNKAAHPYQPTTRPIHSLSACVPIAFIFILHCSKGVKQIIFTSADFNCLD